MSAAAVAEPESQRSGSGTVGRGGLCEVLELAVRRTRNGDLRLNICFTCRSFASLSLSLSLPLSDLELQVPRDFSFGSCHQLQRMSRHGQHGAQQLEAAVAVLLGTKQ